MARTNNFMKRKGTRHPRSLAFGVIGSLRFAVIRLSEVGGWRSGTSAGSGLEVGGKREKTEVGGQKSEVRSH